MIRISFGRPGRPRLCRLYPALEVLEDRVLPSFLAPRTFDTGSDPVAVAVADLTGDGIPDLVTADYFGGTVSILRGNGDGSFQPAVSYPAGSGPGAVAVGDFDGDGIPDLAVADFGSNSVSILRGNGDGSFQAPKSYAAGSSPTSVAVADFNGDGIPDLAVTDNPSVDNGTLNVLRGNGDGSFQAPKSYAAGASPHSVVAADFNGDGIADLAVANSNADAVSVLLGNGDGSFQGPASYRVGRYPLRVAVGDFNGDGRPDLVTANTTDSTASVLLGNGDGTFRPAVSYADADLSTVAVGDVNGDGILDFVTTANFGSRVGVHLGNGDGTFRPVVSYDTAQDTSAVAVADLNGDGVADVVTTSYFIDRVTVLLGKGDGSLQAAPSYSTEFTPTDVAVGDLNGDGVPDLVTADSIALGGYVSVLLGNGDGSFRLAAYYPVNDSGPNGVVLGDFNGDGNLDMAVTLIGLFGPNRVAVFLGNGDGTFQPPISSASGPFPYGLAAADLGRAGVLDLVVTNASQDGTVSVLRGNGDGTFQPPQSYAVGRYPEAVTVRDVNGDGVPDLVVADFGGLSGTGSVSVLLGNGDGSFQPAVTYPTTGAETHSVAVADVNGDGVPDLVAANFVSDTGSFPGNVSLLLGNGDGTFQPAVNIAAGYSPYTVAVAAVSGDGRPDLIVADGDANTVNVLDGNGDGTFRFAAEYLAGSSPGQLVVADLNGDGLPDVVATTYNAVSVLLNAGDGLAKPGPTPRSEARPGDPRDPSGEAPAMGSLQPGVTPLALTPARPGTDDPEERFGTPGTGTEPRTTRRQARSVGGRPEVGWVAGLRYDPWEEEERLLLPGNAP
jgi:hypothetical protein